MSKAEAEGRAQPKPSRSRKPQVIPIEYAGRWVAWEPTGMRIVAVADSFEACEQAAAEAGYPRVAVDRIPDRGQRGWHER